MSPDITMSTHVQDVENLIESYELSDFVLWATATTGWSQSKSPTARLTELQRWFCSTPSCPKTESRCSTCCRGPSEWTQKQRP
jgi:hypothetical protein